MRNSSSNSKEKRKKKNSTKDILKEASGETNLQKHYKDENLKEQENSADFLQNFSNQKSEEVDYNVPIKIFLELTEPSR